MERLNQSVAYIKARLTAQPAIALILGTGLGDFADLMQDAVTIPYGDIPHFPVSTAPYHKGQLVAGTIGEKYVLVMQGRFHYYEGYSMQEIGFPIRVLKLLGIKTLFVSNAAGAINESYRVGDLMMMTDHIKFFNDTPLRGQNIDAFGPRFNDMSTAYTPALQGLAQKIADEKGIDLQQGVYAYMPGPCYETPAEIRMLGILGADAVGMSTVPEVITAAHSGMDVFGISFCVNMAAGLCKKIEHLDFSKTAIENFKLLISEMIKAL
ncbi:MAG: purine-nucleoside phosphorylase [Ruminococcaceae bacterium]|nr:purine-nucleoside phosphorylase [Oscillospiraceae bacterium]